MKLIFGRARFSVDQGNDLLTSRAILLGIPHSGTVSPLACISASKFEDAERCTSFRSASSLELPHRTQFLVPGEQIPYLELSGHGVQEDAACAYVGDVPPEICVRHIAE